MKIAAFGDIHNSVEPIRSLPLNEFDLVIITGDLTNFGGRDDAMAILDTVRQATKNILAVPGNLDHPPVLELLEELDISIHGKGKIINERIGIFGCGGSNLTPFNTPIEFSEEKLLELLHQAYEHVQDANLHILVSHTPPKDSGLDRISSGANVGSQVVREFIEEVQPALCLTGHIHEAKGETELGKTKVINPGMLKDGGWIEIDILDDLTVKTILH